MSLGMVKLNKAKCLDCGDILISKDANKYEKCSCGSLAIRGGSHFLERKGKNYKELSLMIDISTVMTPNENIGQAPPKQ
jgi:hypothetical protein